MSGINEELNLTTNMPAKLSEITAGMGSATSAARQLEEATRRLNDIQSQVSQRSPSWQTIYGYTLDNVRRGQMSRVADPTAGWRAIAEEQVRAEKSAQKAIVAMAKQAAIDKVLAAKQAADEENILQKQYVRSQLAAINELEMRVKEEKRAEILAAKQAADEENILQKQYVRSQLAAINELEMRVKEEKRAEILAAKQAADEQRALTSAATQSQQQIMAPMEKMIGFFSRWYIILMSIRMAFDGLRGAWEHVTEGMENSRLETLMGTKFGASGTSDAMAFLKSREKSGIAVMHDYMTSYDMFATTTAKPDNLKRLIKMTEALTLSDPYHQGYDNTTQALKMFMETGVGRGLENRYGIQKYWLDEAKKYTGNANTGKVQTPKDISKFLDAMDKALGATNRSRAQMEEMMSSPAQQLENFQHKLHDTFVFAGEDFGKHIGKAMGAVDMEGFFAKIQASFDKVSVAFGNALDKLNKQGIMDKIAGAVSKLADWTVSIVNNFDHIKTVTMDMFKIFLAMKAVQLIGMLKGGLPGIFGMGSAATEGFADLMQFPLTVGNFGSVVKNAGTMLIGAINPVTLGLGIFATAVYYAADQIEDAARRMNDVATKALQDQKVEINHQDSVNARAKMWGLNRAKLVSQLQDSGVIKKTTQYLNPHTGAWQDQYVSPEAEKNRDFKSYGNPNNPKEETTRTGYFSPTADTSALEHYMNVHGYGGDNRKLANPDKTIDSVGKIVAPVKVDTELLSLMSDMAERDYIHNVNLAHTTPEIHIHTGTLDGKTIGPMVAEHVKKALVDLMSGGTSNSYGEVAYAAN